MTMANNRAVKICVMYRRVHDVYTIVGTDLYNIMYSCCRYTYTQGRLNHGRGRYIPIASG